MPTSGSAYGDPWDTPNVRDFVATSQSKDPNSWWAPNTSYNQDQQWQLWKGTTQSGANNNPVSPTNKYATTASSGGGSRGGGGGGGGAAAPQLNQGTLDWYASMLKNAKPYGNQYNALTMPQWNDVNITPFDTGQYDQLRGALGQAVSADQSTANTAYDQLSNYLSSNYSNPYDNASYATTATAPGATQQAMQRLLASQGMQSSNVNPLYNQAQNADQAFGNLLGLLGTNENQAQRNRLNNVQADRGTTTNALNMAALQGNTAIGQQQAQAKSAWQQRADDRSLLNAQTRYQGDTQGALANWQRQNEVGDTNNAAQSAYYNSVLSALSNLLPSLVAQGGSLNLPDYAAFGLT
jgi:hypothetical protein